MFRLARVWMNKISWEADAICPNQSLDVASEDASGRGHWHPFKCRLSALRASEYRTEIASESRPMGVLAKILQTWHEFTPLMFF